MYTQRHTHVKKVLYASGALLLCMLVVPTPAHAYLDPGTGSFIIQILLATVAGIGYLVRVFWNGIKNFFTSLFSRGKKPVETDGAHNHDEAQKGNS